MPVRVIALVVLVSGLCVAAVAALGAQTSTWTAVGIVAALLAGVGLVVLVRAVVVLERREVNR